jgi:hypothetical protein
VGRRFDSDASSVSVAFYDADSRTEELIKHRLRHARRGCRRLRGFRLGDQSGLREQSFEGNALADINVDELEVQLSHIDLFVFRQKNAEASARCSNAAESSSLRPSALLAAAATAALNVWTGRLDSVFEALSF